MGGRGPKGLSQTRICVKPDGEDMIVANSNPLIQIPTALIKSISMQKVSVFKHLMIYCFDFGVHYTSTSEFSKI